MDAADVIAWVIVVFGSTCGCLNLAKKLLVEILYRRLWRLWLKPSLRENTYGSLGVRFNLLSTIRTITGVDMPKEIAESFKSEMFRLGLWKYSDIELDYKPLPFPGSITQKFRR